VNASVEIIIVNHNTAAELGDCLASLRDARPSCVSSIVVVDNASADGSIEMVRSRFQDVGLVRLATNAGFGAANNVALRQSQSPHVLLLNSDTVVPAGAIDGLLSRFLARGAAAAGPLLVDGTGRPEVSFGPMLTPWNEFVQRRRMRKASSPGPRAEAYVRRLIGHERFVDWVSGACLLVDRLRVAEAGFFDERYFLYEEDVDLCAALRKRGHRILFTPEYRVVHLRGRSTKTGPARSQPSHYDRSHLAFYEKHSPFWAPWLRTWLRMRGRSIR
jgi:N-acetylglucosaminyl-diphospho-decaprenol L-rhamnosyltransferase